MKFRVLLSALALLLEPDFRLLNESDMRLDQLLSPLAYCFLGRISYMIIVYEM